MSCNNIVCKFNIHIFSMYISYVKFIIEKNYINHHILSIDLWFSAFRIPQIICFALKNSRFSNFQVATFPISEILFFQIKKCQSSYLWYLTSRFHKSKNFNQVIYTKPCFSLDNLYFFDFKLYILCSYSFLFLTNIYGKSSSPIGAYILFPDSNFKKNIIKQCLKINEQ